MASEALTARADVWAIGLVDGSVALHVVGADERLGAVVALELAVAEMVLDVRGRVLVAAEMLVATPAVLVDPETLILVDLRPAGVEDVGVHHLGGDTSLHDRAIDAFTEVVESRRVR